MYSDWFERSNHKNVNDSDGKVHRNFMKVERALSAAVSSALSLLSSPYRAPASPLEHSIRPAFPHHNIYLYSGFKSPFSIFSYSVKLISGPAFSRLLF